MQRLKHSPWPMHAAVLRSFGAVRLDEMIDQLLDVLIPVAARNEDGVPRIDDDKVIDTECGDEPLFTSNVIVSRIVKQDIAGYAIARGILFAATPHHRPRTDIAPTHGRRNNGSILRSLHHGII